MPLLGPRGNPPKAGGKAGTGGAQSPRRQAPEDHWALPGLPWEAGRAGGGAVNGLRALGSGCGSESQASPQESRASPRWARTAGTSGLAPKLPKPGAAPRVTSLLQALTVAWMFLFRLHHTLTTPPTRPQAGSRRSVTCQAELRRGGAVVSFRPHSPHPIPTLYPSLHPSPPAPPPWTW